MNILLSLCIPTNGKTEWVIPVLDSIFENDSDTSKYEVVIEDNGGNAAFESKIIEYQAIHNNLMYYKSTAKGFLCQIDCFKHASGQFIKFLNHRAKLTNLSLDYLIKFAEENINDKPVVYFSNGSVNYYECSTFNDFVCKLDYWSSWSGGLAFWKEDIKRLDNMQKFNELFPHTDLLFSRRDANKYIIIERNIFTEIVVSQENKGKYNLFKAFCVEYLSIINDMVRDGSVTVDTFLTIKKSLLGFITDLYIDFIIRKKKTSYELDDCGKYMKVYYSKTEFILKLIQKLCYRVIRKVLG